MQPELSLLQLYFYEWKCMCIASLLLLAYKKLNIVRIEHTFITFVRVTSGMRTITSWEILSDHVHTDTFTVHGRRERCSKRTSTESHIRKMSRWSAQQTDRRETNQKNTTNTYHIAHTTRRTKLCCIFVTYGMILIALLRTRFLYALVSAKNNCKTHSKNKNLPKFLTIHCPLQNNWLCSFAPFSFKNTAPFLIVTLTYLRKNSLPQPYTSYDLLISVSISDI